MNYLVLGRRPGPTVPTPFRHHGRLPAPAEVDDATWDRVMAINLTAPMRLTRAVLPGMIAAGGGAIANVVSEAALRGSAAGGGWSAV